MCGLGSPAATVLKSKLWVFIFTVFHRPSFPPTHVVHHTAVRISTTLQAYIHIHHAPNKLQDYSRSSRSNSFAICPFARALTIIIIMISRRKDGAALALLASSVCLAQPRQPRTTRTSHAQLSESRVLYTHLDLFLCIVCGAAQ